MADPLTVRVGNVKVSTRAAEDKLLSALERGGKQAGLFLAGRVQESINRGNRLGRDPSKPGEPPKKRTARLFKSIASESGRDGRSLLIVVGTNVKYARPLELGTQDGKLAARPYLRPALLKHRDDVARIIAMALKRG